jgi:hypothetical protein
MYELGASLSSLPRPPPLDCPICFSAATCLSAVLYMYELGAAPLHAPPSASFLRFCHLLSRCFVHVRTRSCAAPRAVAARWAARRPAIAAALATNLNAVATAVGSITLQALKSHTRFHSSPVLTLNKRRSLNPRCSLPACLFHLPRVGAATPWRCATLPAPCSLMVAQRNGGFNLDANAISGNG